MGRRLRDLVCALKDKASLSAALLCSSSAAAAASTSSPRLAVLRATTHHPSFSPRHLDALLTYGHGSRLAAAACTDALLSRLRSTRHPSVALKSLLAAHHILTHGSFVLRDHLISASLRPSSGRNPLNLSSFRDASSAESWALSDWVRWFARLLEMLLLAAARVVVSADDDRVASLTNVDILIEIEALVAVVEEVVKAPEAVEGNELVAEAVRLVEEDRLTAERGILVRIREMGERLALLRFGELVELVCLLKRLEECGDHPVGGPWRSRPREWLWSEVRDVMGRSKDVVVREEGERERMTRDRASESTRLTNRIPLLTAETVRFGSRRLEGGRPLK